METPPKSMERCLEENRSIIIRVDEANTAILQGSVHRPNDYFERAKTLFKKSYGQDLIDDLLDPNKPEKPYQCYITNRSSWFCFFQSNSLLGLHSYAFGIFTLKRIEKILFEVGKILANLYYRDEKDFEITDFFPEITVKNCLTMSNVCTLPMSLRKRKNYMIPSFLIPFIMDYIFATSKRTVVQCLSRVRTIINHTLSGIEKCEKVQFEYNCDIVLKAIQFKFTPNKSLQWTIAASRGKLIGDKESDILEKREKKQEKERRKEEQEEKKRRKEEKQEEKERKKKGKESNSSFYDNKIYKKSIYD